MWYNSATLRFCNNTALLALRGKQKLRPTRIRDKIMGNIKLSFTRFEYAAIVKVALTMATADGHVDENEKLMVVGEALRFNIKNEDFKGIYELSKELSAADSILFISKMDETHKRYVAAYLGTMISIDGNIDDEEVKFWRLVSSLADLPTMSIAEAEEYMSNL